MEDFWIFFAYAIGGLVIIGLGCAFYARSVASRKSYRCEACGERVAVELMEARHCNQCGAPLTQEQRDDRS